MQFEYKIKKSKGRTIRISINRMGEVFLHVPRFVPEFIAKRFLVSKKDWVEKVLGKQKKQTPGGRGISAKEQRKQYLENKETARALVNEKLDYWKKFYGENFQIDFSWRGVAIKNSKTRWGSCSSRKNLNFSYKIIFLTPEAQDYLIVHELSHLSQMNHSNNFWTLVALAIPNYKKLKKELGGI